MVNIPIMSASRLLQGANLPRAMSGANAFFPRNRRDCGLRKPLPVTSMWFYVIFLFMKGWVDDKSASSN